jgi:putative ABC transport system substrate-binding protein
MNRRQALLVLLSLGTAPMAAFAQTQRPPRRIGFLSLGSAQGVAGSLSAFREGMSALGWVDGRDYVIDPRYANSVAQAGPALAAELVATRPDLLLVPAEEHARLLTQGGGTIPIVFAIAQDPIGNGTAASLRRPGGNVTGLTSLATELSAKRLQLLKGAFPRVAHVALLFEPGNLGSVSQVKEATEAAARLGMRISPIELKQPADIDPAFKRAAALGVQGYMAAAGGITISQRQAIVDRIVGLKAPAMFPVNQYAEAGGLMSYGASFTENFRRAASYVDKIFKGAKPGELPIEQPTKFELVVNMKTAKAMGFTFPEAFMVGVDRVIE